MISFVIPAFNEERRLGRSLEELHSFLRKQGKPFEIIVVFDGSDNTPAVVNAFSRKHSLGSSVRLLVFKRRLGKGGGLMKGLAAAKGETVFMLDADSSAPTSEIPKLLRALENCDIAIGSRYTRASKSRLPLVRRIFAFTFNKLVKALFFLPYSDTQCGLKGFRRQALEKLLPQIKTTNFVWDVDMLVQARKLGLRVKEVPIDWNFGKGGSITYSNGLQTSLRMFVTLLKLRFSQ